MLMFVGRAWIFGDRVDTDALYPSHTLNLDIGEAASYVLRSIRPGWTSQVEPGDILVGGRDFGIGSGRPVAKLLHHLGIGAIVAEEFGSLFFRNCINYGFPAMAVPDVRKAVAEGDIVEIDVVHATFRNRTSGRELKGERYPSQVLEILRAGGVVPRLRAEGYLPPSALG